MYIYSVSGRVGGYDCVISYGSSELADDPVLTMPGSAATLSMYKLWPEPLKPKGFGEVIEIFSTKRGSSTIDMEKLSRYPGIGTYSSLIARPILMTMRETGRTLGECTVAEQEELYSLLQYYRAYLRILFSVSVEGKITLLLCGGEEEKSALGKVLVHICGLIDYVELSPSNTEPDRDISLMKYRKAIQIKDRLYRLFNNTTTFPRHLMDLYETKESHVMREKDIPKLPTKLELKYDKTISSFPVQLSDSIYYFPLGVAGRCVTLCHLIGDCDYKGEIIPMTDFSLDTVKAFVDLDDGYAMLHTMSSRLVLEVLKFADFVNYKRLSEIVYELGWFVCNLSREDFDTFIGDHSLIDRRVSEKFCDDRIPIHSIGGIITDIWMR
jgi:hypothetical protein